MSGAKKVVAKKVEESELPVGRKIVLALRDLRAIYRRTGVHTEAGITNAIALLSSITLGDIA